MNFKWIQLTILFTCVTIGLMAQVKTFKFKDSEKPFAEHSFQKVSVIDGRENKRNIGLVQKGVNNTLAAVMIDPSLEEALQDFLNPLLSNAGGKKRLIIHIRQLSFSEFTRTFKEEGFFRIRAEAYEQTDNGYLPLSKIDTLVIVSGLDVTNNLLKSGQRTIYHWVDYSLRQKPVAENYYSAADILNIDRIEKQKIPLYNNPELPKGLYQSYQDLAQRQPSDTSINFEYDDQTGRIRATRTDDNGNSKVIRLTSKTGYAVSFDNKLWILVPEGYAMAKFRDGSLYYMAPYNLMVAKANNANSYMLFGLVGGTIYSMNNSEEKLTNFMVDHLNGGQIPVK